MDIHLPKPSLMTLFCFELYDLCMVILAFICSLLSDE